MSQNDFLVEIQTEELPPKSLKMLAEKFLEEIQTRLTKSDFTFQGAKYFATPRRLAVLINHLDAEQPDKTIERKGPALDKAYDASGNPTPACLGFAKSANVDVSELIKLPGNFVGCKQHIKGKTVFEIMPQIVSESLAALPIPKPMRWGNHTEKFIRPVHSVILLYGKEIIPAIILGIQSGNKTQGHRFLHPEEVEITSPAHYESALLAANVIVDFEKRKEKIYQDSRNLVTQKLGPTILFPKDVALLEEVTSLVEWPKAILGNFDKKFLEVPLEALTSAMKDHQRYFPIYSGPNQLLPNFIAVSNIEGKDKRHIIAGNERVLRARLADAAFFYETDKKIKLSERLEKLKHIVFQNKLGSIFDKTERIKKLAAIIATQVGAEKSIAVKAAELSKSDLTTELVGEFPELQGIAGYYYATNEGNADIATALKEQYLPKFSGDILPNTKAGIALALADRIDTLVGIFGINQAPTGDKDPFGLRRAALGVLRILIEKHINLDLKELITKAADHYTTLDNKNVISDTLNFILERIKAYYAEAPATVIASVMALNLFDPYDMIKRIDAVIAFDKLPEAESLSIANKRVSNILAKYTDIITETTINEKLFESDSEKNLTRKLNEQEKIIANLNNYQAVLSQLASLKEPVDDFFDNVMVMTDDKSKRENRILILKKLRELFLHVADIALLQ